MGMTRPKSNVSACVSAPCCALWKPSSSRPSFIQMSVSEFEKRRDGGDCSVTECSLLCAAAGRIYSEPGTVELMVTRTAVTVPVTVAMGGPEA